MHGLISRPTALALGASDHLIARALASGNWEEIHPGVYYLNATPRTWLTDIAAGVLAAGSGAVASHRTAARIWGLEGFTSSAIELTVPISNDPMPEGVIVHRTRRPRIHKVRESIPVTSVERTILDLAAQLSDRILGRTLQSAIRKRLTTAALVARILRTDGGRGVTGTRRLRRVLGRVADELSGSVAEAELRDLLTLAPIPGPASQYLLELPNGDIAYADFAWPELRKVVELDGFMAHSSPEQLQADLRRQNLILDMGWDLRRFTVRDIRYSPTEVVGEIVRFVNS